MRSNNKLKGKAIYTCYFGLREPLVQTQVLPYIRQIRDGGMKMSILTFETDPHNNWSEEEIKKEKKKLADEGIDWYFLTYHKKPTVPATIYDVLSGAFFIWKFIRRENPDIIHARVHIPALMGAIAKKFVRNKPKMLFDIRGFFPEEYTDAGRWKENGKLYRSVKRIERWLLRESNGFVVLTEKAREILFPESREKGVDKFGRPVEVIPCCVDLAKFDIDKEKSRAKIRAKIGGEDRQVIAYVGSFGGYYLTKETADFYRIAKMKNPKTFALILTQSDPNIIKPLLKKFGFTKNEYFIQKVSPAEIPQYLSAADFALSFIKPSYSKIASSPTKNAEYLACGLPVVVNDKVGDTTDHIDDNNVGVVIEGFTDDDLIQAYEQINDLSKSDRIADQCFKSAKSLFDLNNVGGMKYRRLYNRLINK